MLDLDVVPVTFGQTLRGLAVSEILQKYLAELIAQREETARRFVEGEGDKYESAAKSAARFVQIQQAITILENDGKIPLTVLSGRVDE